MVPVPASTAEVDGKVEMLVATTRQVRREPGNSPAHRATPHHGADAYGFDSHPKPMHYRRRRRHGDKHRQCCCNDGCRNSCYNVIALDHEARGNLPPVGHSIAISFRRTSSSR